MKQTRSSDGRIVRANVTTHFAFLHENTWISSLYTTKTEISICPQVSEFRISTLLKDKAWEDVCSYMSGDDLAEDNIFSDLWTKGQKDSSKGEAEHNQAQILKQIEDDFFSAPSRLTPLELIAAQRRKMADNAGLACQPTVHKTNDKNDRVDLSLPNKIDAVGDPIAATPVVEGVYYSLSADEPGSLFEKYPTIQEINAAGQGDASEPATMDDDKIVVSDMPATDSEYESKFEMTTGPVTENAPSADVSADRSADPRETTDRHSGRASLLTQSPEAGVSRILKETDEQFQEPEGNRRRDAVAYFKVAVAATEAAQELHQKENRTFGGTKFREYLDHILQQRPTTRPESYLDYSRPSPLKLGASQRVYMPQVADAPHQGSGGKEVLPNRVQNRTSELQQAEGGEDTGRFAEFASDMGAVSLIDMFEAAAAYSALIEGEEDVSRPHIFKMAQSILPEIFSQEDGLRAFGTLLRQGRIQKVRNGRFKVTDPLPETYPAVIK